MGEQKEDMWFTTVHFLRQYLVDFAITPIKPPSGKGDLILVTNEKKRLLITPFYNKSYKLTMCDDFPKEIYFPSNEKYDYDYTMTNCDYMTLALKIGVLLS